MKNISKNLSFDTPKEKLDQELRRIQSAIYKDYLRHTPTREELEKFTQNTNKLNITDYYFDGEKIGSLSTIYMLDQPRNIVIEFRAC